jgi:cobalt transporter subunit CbtA
MRSVLLIALVSGLFAGLVFFGVQSVTTRPLIAQAEVYEQAELRAAPPMQGTTSHQHAWEPEEGIERAAYTLAADVMIGVGYAFLLVGVVSVSGRNITTASGLAWGAAGFLVFVAAPSLGLPPEPPGGHSAELLLRQVWWLGTASATAAGLWLLFMQRNGWLRFAGVALLVVPHVIGAPRLTDAGVEVHGELTRQFIWASLTANAALWATLGLAVGRLYSWSNRLLAGSSLSARV